jgi:hypothetical protein
MSANTRATRMLRLITTLEAEKSLPEHIAVKPTEKVDNPFK